MEIVTTVHRCPSKVRLSEEFLSPYRQQGDPFPSLLARSTYLTKYCRGNVETWTDTIRRVVEGNVNLAPPGVSQREAQELFHLFWTGQALPPGRGLWTGGVPGIPADASYNCWGTTLRSINDWTWTANQLMLGGGVGVGLGSLNTFPAVTDNQSQFAIWCKQDHPDYDEVHPEGPAFLNGSTPRYLCEDSREGWVTSLGKVLEAAYAGKDLVIDVSDVRPRGSLIRTFGGIACGPGPLVYLLRSAWGIVRGARGRRLTSVEALDITNHIGLCIKSGNIRRSALLALGEATDQAFRDAKKDWEAVSSHRHTSNNSIMFRSWGQLEDFNWESLVDDNIKYGEPGILNLPLIWRTDPDVRVINPCGEIPLSDRSACNLAEIFPAKFESTTDPRSVFRLVTRYSLRQRLPSLTDPESDYVRKKEMKLGVGLGGICDFDWTPEMLAGWYGVVRAEADRYADELRVNRPIAVTTTKPSGTISLLNGSSPGIHAPHAEYYIRRTRIAKHDPMAEAMMAAGVPFEEDVYDKTNRTWVFSFPAKASNTRATSKTETLREQFERQATIQEWWSDNAVSATLNFDPETERAELASCLKEFVPRLKSMSCLPRSHAYSQPPYEGCDQFTYEKLYRQIDHSSPLVNSGDLETLQGLDECSGGVCPVR